MPNYDYVCDNCNYKEEILQKMSDLPLTECPKCKQKSFKRKFGVGIGLQFQGSGFYSTDYGTKPEETTSSSSSKKTSSSSSCGCGKTSCSS